MDAQQQAQQEQNAAMQHQQQQANMQMIYNGQQQQQQQQSQGGGNEAVAAAVQQQNPVDAAAQQQQQAYGQGYPQGMFGQMPFFGQQGQASAATSQAAGYPQMDYSGMMASQYSTQGSDPQDYMNANQYLLARLQQGGPWGMPMGYGMPQGMEGYESLAPWSTTSAGLLGKIGGTEQKKKNVRKKHKDKPKRPLSAYNLFFKDERKKILESIPAKPEEDDDKDELDEDGKKKKKPPHGKIGFENLAKIIGQRWQKLEPDRIEHYKKLAGKDMKRYKDQMEVFLTKIENEKKKKFEEDNGIPAAEETTEGGGEGDDSGEPPAKKAKTDDDDEEAKVEVETV